MDLIDGKSQSDASGVTKDDPRLWLVFLIFLPLILNTIRSPNNDFGTVSVIVREWVTGKVTLYNAGSVYFNYTPWLLFFYIPFAFIPHPFGQLIFNTISVCLVIWSTWYMSKPISWKLMAISLTTIYMAMLIMQGQWDGMVLASLTLGWIAVQKKNPWLLGLALVGMTTKYTNVIIPILLLLLAIRKWPIKKILLTTVIPVLTVIISFIIAGWDWPIRYYRLLREILIYFHQYQVSTIFSSTYYPISYRLIQPPLGYLLVICLAIISLYLLVRISRRTIDLKSINLGLALNLVVSPYFTFHHIIYLAPLQAQLFKKNQLWGVVLFGAAIIDLVLLWLGVGLIIYPLAALIVVCIIAFRDLRFKKSDLSVQVENSG